jgi:magnesium transporter
MLNVFTLVNGRLVQEEIESLEDLARFKPIWVDMEAPTPEERRWVRQHFGLSIPEDAMDEDIEESARFFEEDNGELHVRSDFLIADEDDPRHVRVAFILNDRNPDLNSHGVLFSIHDEDVPVFRLLRLRARRMPGLIDDAKDVLLSLYDTDAEYCADTLEEIYNDLERISTKVLSGQVTDDIASEVLASIARHEDMSGRIRRNMMDTRRAVSFMMRSRMLSAEQFEDARQILRDLDSLDSPRLFVRENQLPDGTPRSASSTSTRTRSSRSSRWLPVALPAANADRQHLRHELRVHARAQPEVGLSCCAFADGAQRRGADAVFPQARLAQVKRCRSGALTTG